MQSISVFTRVFTSEEASAFCTALWNTTLNACRTKITCKVIPLKSARLSITQNPTQQHYLSRVELGVGRSGDDNGTQITQLSLKYFQEDLNTCLTECIHRHTQTRPDLEGELVHGVDLVKVIDDEVEQGCSDSHGPVVFTSLINLHLINLRLQHLHDAKAESDREETTNAH